jgi:hypothetical protein
VVAVCPLPIVSFWLGKVITLFCDKIELVAWLELSYKTKLEQWYFFLLLSNF